MPTHRLLVLIAANFFVATSFMSVGGLLDEIAADPRIPIEQGLLIAAFGITAAICAPTLVTLGSHSIVDVCSPRRWSSARSRTHAPHFSHWYSQLMFARI